MSERRGRPLVVPEWVWEDPDTGVKQLWRWCLAEGSLASAATIIGWNYSRLYAFLHDAQKGIGARAAVNLSRETGIPTEALVFKTRPLSELTTPWEPPEDTLGGWEV